MKKFLTSKFVAKWRLLWASNILGNVSHTADQTRKKTTLISMIRNEKRILETFCGHTLSLFDRIIFIDHLSSDGTREYVKLLSERHPCVEYYLFDEPGYYQSELMTWAVQNLVANKTPGWVFFLDADEFLPFNSREEFQAKLLEFGSFPVIFLPWLNLVPLDMESGRIMDGVFLKPSKPSRHHKIAFQPSRIPAGNYFIAQGNHSLFMGTRSSKIKFPAKKSFPIYHLPIRTKEQLREKILYGVESYKRMGADRRGKIGAHWDEIHRIMEANSLTDDLIAGIIVQYSEALHSPFERSFDQLRESGYSEVQMKVSFSPPLVSFVDDIENQRDELIIGNFNPSIKVSDQVENFSKIKFDRSSRSMQMIQ